MLKNVIITAPNPQPQYAKACDHLCTQQKEIFLTGVFHNYLYDCLSQLT